MKSTVTITIYCNELRDDMITYHKRAYELNKNREANSETQRQAQSYHWQATVHKEMMDFWEQVVIEHDKELEKT